MKKILLSLILALSSACQNIQVPETRQIEIKENEKKYTLEELCDTETYEKNVKLNVYIQDSERLWDYHMFKSDIFNYVENFFLFNRVKIKISYSDTKFREFNKPDEFGIEIYDSEDSFKKRYYELSPENSNIDAKLNNSMGFPVTKKGIALINGGWEEFRNSKKEELQESYRELLGNKTITKGEFILRTNAGLICHEVLECMGLTHPWKYKNLVEKRPNVMSYDNPDFELNSIGYNFSYFQKKFIHSFIAGNKVYQLFQESGKDLNKFWEKIK